MPFFTVVIPTYNRSEFLKGAIQSVLDQTFQDFEVIVIDDHSTDNTKEVVESFHDDCITYILNDRARGGAGTRNAGIFRAKGQWVAFLDDDDVWLPQKLELQYNKIQEEADNTIGLIYTGYVIYDFNNKKDVSLIEPLKKGWIKNDLFYGNDIGTFSTVVIRNSLLKQVGGLDERFPASQDYELYIRIAELSKVDFVKDNLTFVRQANTDRMSFDLHKKLIARLLFLEKYREIIDSIPKLRHHVKARIFVAAAIEGDWKNAFESLPWTLAGVILDTPNFIKTLKTILSLIYRKKIVKSYGV